eukprot:1159211-Pelagomonas_calceolata.AAC.4
MVQEVLRYAKKQQMAAFCLRKGGPAWGRPTSTAGEIKCMPLLASLRREISNYREDCDKLARDQRLHDSVALKRPRQLALQRAETVGMRQMWG